jgi:hypothetical protein
MRLAAIDIGTNSVHMIVVRVRPDFSFEVIDREKEMVRLGAGGLDGRKLTRAAQSAALQALSKFERIASHQVTRSCRCHQRHAGPRTARSRRHRQSQAPPTSSRHRGRAAHPVRPSRRGYAEGRRRYRHRRWQRGDHAGAVAR